MSMPGPRTAAPGGGFSRSAGAAAGRGVLLIVFALALGILLLAKALDGGNSSGVGEAATSATSAPASTSAPPTSAEPGATTAPATTLPPAHQAAEVPVLVLNGRQVQGVARANNDVLLRLGYNGLPPGNTAQAVAATTVYYTDPAFQADAVAVAQALTIPADKVAPLGDVNLGEDLKNAKVVVVLGQDGLGAKPS